MKKYFCTKCGSQLEPIECRKRGNYFNTGKPYYGVIYRCPNVNEDYWSFDESNGHTSCEKFMDQEEYDKIIKYKKLLKILTQLK